MSHSDADDLESVPAAVLQLCAEAAWYQQQGKFDEAVRLFRRALALKPDFAKALNSLGCALLAQGKRDKAANTFRQLLLLMPELFDTYADLIAILIQVNPVIKDAMVRVSVAWPKLLPAKEFLGPAGIAAIAGDPLLRVMLESIAVRDIDLERVLTSVRRSVLRRAADSGDKKLDEQMLGFFCALAKQCFINEYVFAAAPQELEEVEWLKELLVGRIAAKGLIPLLWPVAVASFVSLHSLPNADALLDRRWPNPVDELLTQQLREPSEEQQYCNSIPRLTVIADEVSVRVRQQYEENPYPRWVLAPSRRAPLNVNEYLRREFPSGTFRDLDTTGGVDMLIAGCGTGQHPIGMARLFKDVEVLAVDLSLRSLSYAERKTRALGLDNIEYAQADILQFASIGRTFDIIDASGVLHHLADPLTGWRILLALLRPGGLMHVGLYSEIGRREVVAARAFIAEHAYRPTSDDIRRCRQELMTTPLEGIARIYDFFSMSECRDLLFHVQEHRLTIPEIKSFLGKNNLTFIGFKVGAAVRAQYCSRFSDDRSMTNLDHWHNFEQENPTTFASMYKIWMQKE